MRTVVLATAIGISAVGLSVAADSQAAIRRHTDIPAQALRPALHTLSNDCDIQLVFRTDVVGDVRTSGAVGELTVTEALTHLLSGTGLTYRYLDDKTVTIVPVAASSSEGATSVAPVAGQSPSSSVGEPTSAAGASKKSFWQRLRLAQAETSSRSEGDRVSGRSSVNSQKRIELEEIVVTGTHIRGAEVSSPVLTITQEEMRLSGHNNLGEVIRALPQNFSGGQNPEVGTGANLGSAANQNITGASSFNLRGLGHDATLTLLNGTRLPYDGLYQATDVSVVPVAAIERVEVLLDGASAIYGSDAVGGVANIILKRDYEGAELSARYGESTDGGYAQQQYSAVAGHTWRSGGVLVTGDFSKNTAVLASDRGYLRHMPLRNTTVYPASTQKGGLLSAHQNLGDLVGFTLDAFYAERRQDEDRRQGASTSFSVTTRDSTIWGLAPAVSFVLPGAWSLRLHGAFGEDEAEADARNFSIATGAQTFASLTGFFNEAESAGAEAEGPLPALAGGEARLSLGGGYRKNKFHNINLATGSTFIKGSDDSYHGYAEFHLPLVSEDQRIPALARLALNGALRHENYESFGGVTTPKVGIVWSVVPGLDIRASWGRSFKVPTLREQFALSSAVVQLASSFPGTPAGRTVLALFGGNPGLGPERAEVVTAGFVARPEFLPGFTLELGGFDIDYTDRVVTPISPTSQALINPAFAEFVTLSPTTAQQDAAIAAADQFILASGVPSYDPTSVHAIVHNRLVNATAQRVRGVDVSVRYTSELFNGRFTASGTANWIDSTRKLTALAPEQETAGFVFFPAKFRSRLGFSWSRGALTLSSALNHIDGVTNTFVTPNAKGSSMTTVDLITDYQVDSGPLGEIGLNLAVTNLLNERPPSMQHPSFPFLANYDSTNYSALGRLVSATVTKRF